MPLIVRKKKIQKFRGKKPKLNKRGKEGELLKLNKGW